MATKKTTKTVDKKPVKKEVKHITPELIYDVLRGEYGPEGERNIALTRAGYSPSAVTRKINDLKKLIPQYVALTRKAGEYYPAFLELVASKE